MSDPNTTRTHTTGPGAAADYAFDLDGGRVCLDFANTISSSGEHLNGYADLVAFAQQSRLLTPEDAAWLQAEARRDQATAGGVFVRARRLRDTLRHLFLNVATGKRPTDADLGVLNFDLAASLSHARVLPRGPDDGYAWGWSGRNLDGPIWPITRDAAELLVSDEQLGLVRECGANACQWLFIDSTRNRSRQWCSMSACGNREKARRHYRRQKARLEPGSPRVATGASTTNAPH